MNFSLFENKKTRLYVVGGAIVGAAITGLVVAQFKYIGFIPLGVGVLVLVGVLIGHGVSDAPPVLKELSGLFMKNRQLHSLILGFVILSGVFGATFDVTFGARSREQAAIDVRKDEAEEQQRENAKKRTAEQAEKERLAVDAKAAALEKLKKDAGEYAKRYAQQLEEIPGMVKNGECWKAVKKVEELKKETNQYEEVQPLPPEIAALLPEIESLLKSATRCEEIQKALELLEEEKGTAKLGDVEDGLSTSGIWEMQIELYTSALAQIEKLEQVEEEFRYLLPKGLKLPKERGAMENKLEQAKGKLAAIKAEESGLAAERQVLEKRCGSGVIRNLDGEYGAVEAVAKDMAVNPSTVDVDRCSKPELTRKHCWVTTCRVRMDGRMGQMSFSIVNNGMPTVIVE